MNDLWIIEARNPDGSLNFEAPQPETVFGPGAITGLGDWAISRTVYRLRPDAVLTGDNIAHWPTLIDPRFVARRKTWR